MGFLRVEICGDPFSLSVLSVKAGAAECVDTVLLSNEGEDDADTATSTARSHL